MKRSAKTACASKSVGDSHGHGEDDGHGHREDDGHGQNDDNDDSNKDYI